MGLVDVTLGSSAFKLPELIHSRIGELKLKLDVPGFETPPYGDGVLRNNV